MDPKPSTMLELFDRPERWTQHSCGRDADGIMTGATHDNACQWCLAGGVMVVYGLNATPKILDRISAHLGRGASRWNDLPQRKFEDIQQVCRELGL